MDALNPHHVNAVDVVLDRRDLAALMTSLQLNQPSSALVVAYWVLRIALLGGLTIAAVAAPAAGILLAIALGATVVEVVSRRRGRTDPLTFRLLDGRYSITDGGLLRQSATSKTVVRWAAVGPIRSTVEHLTVGIDGSGWVIPFRSFASDQARATFIEALRQRATGSG